jgi:hypothetical protein
LVLQYFIRVFSELPLHITPQKYLHIWSRWLSPVILTTQEAEFQEDCGSKPAHTNSETLSQKNPSQKRADGVAQGVGPEFKAPVQKKKNLQNISASTLITFTTRL